MFPVSQSTSRAPQYFFTVRLEREGADLLVRHIDLLRQCVRLTRQRWPFVIDAAVVLPDRIHMIWSLPPGDPDYGKRWQMIKTTFARHLPARARRDGVWQRRFWEQEITCADDLALFLDALEQAPVEMGLSRTAQGWPHSSAFVRNTTVLPRQHRQHKVGGSAR